MTAPHHASNDEARGGSSDHLTASHTDPKSAQKEADSAKLTAIEILNPDPVSKWNLYVLIGCTVLVALLVFLGPYIYPYVQEFTSTFWN